ncbi:hypothetical protein Dimus_033932 [Dionaea muscipula]
MPPNSVQQSPSASGSVSPRIPGNVMLAASRIQNFGLEERTANFSPMRGPVVADFNYQPQRNVLMESSGHLLANHGSNLTEEELETHTILAWKDGKSHIIRQIDSDGGLYPRLPFLTCFRLPFFGLEMLRL